MQGDTADVGELGSLWSPNSVSAGAVGLVSADKNREFELRRRALTVCIDCSAI